MELADLDPTRPDFAALESAWLSCLEPWNPEAREGRERRLAWYAAVKDRGLFVKLALEGGAPVGMIQCVPIERTTIEGEGLYVVLCVWVHGHAQGVGNHQGHGLGTTLLAAAEGEARRRGARGMVAWGLGLPVWMRARWFARRGYYRVDRLGMSVLMFKPFDPRARAPRWMRPGPAPTPKPGVVSLTCYSSGWCSAQGAACARAHEAAAGFGPEVVIEEIDTSDPAVARRVGQTDAIFLDGHAVRTGPPPSRARLTRLIGRRVRRLGRRWWWPR